MTRRARPSRLRGALADRSDPIELPRFDPDDAETYRREAHGMAEVYLEAVLSVASDAHVSGVYAKGSAYRPWDSLIDYVPELSDVDVHVRLTAEADSGGVLRTLGDAIAVAERALGRYRERFPAPRHVARPQLLFLNDLERLPGYLPSPADTVTTLFGDTYEGGDTASYANASENDVRRFRADALFVREEMPLKVIDRPGPLVWRVVRRLTWRVGPGGPRILTCSGVDPLHAWTVNRTEIVRHLVDLGHDEAAEAYVDFYLAGWAGFRSGFRDGDAARRALLAAARFFDVGAM